MPSRARPRTPTGGDLPFATGHANKRLNALLRAGRFAELSSAEIGFLRALFSLADWRTGAIPHSADRIAEVTRVHRDTVSRFRSKLCDAGLVEVRWRNSYQVQYGLTRLLAAPIS